MDYISIIKAIRDDDSHDRFVHITKPLTL